MIYPVWSGINAEQINSTDVNGCAPTPLVVTDGFSGAVFPVLMGSYPGLYFEVMHVRPEQHALHVKDETQNFAMGSENKNIRALPENRAMDVERSRKRFP